MLTTNLDTSNIYQDSLEMLLDWLAAGLNPEKSPMFRQSQVKEHCELQLIFSMLITVNRLERNPTLKDQIRDLEIENLVYGHLGYPVLQSADILLYKGQVVPVGEDQVPHIEITRELARRFNNTFGQVFPEPEPLLTKTPRLIGLDGNAKMSKSLGNTIFLSDTTEEIKLKLRKAVTDTQKMRKGDPGRPEVCVVFSYHQKFNPDEVQEIAQDCSTGKLGCVDCKLKCTEKIGTFLSPIYEKRKTLENNTGFLVEALNDGETKARNIAKETMSQVRDAMKIG